MPNISASTLTPIHLERRATLGTSEAAAHLNRKASTLYQWAFYGNGPLQPQRINGRLAWPVAEIRKLLGV